MFAGNDEVLLRLVITFPIFLLALSVHEAAHAITAAWGGDLTAAYKGRVTLNPLAHIDPVGTVIVPILGAFSGVPLIGWAKPVPVVESNYRRGDSYGVVVALAGPFSNLLLAIATIILMQISYIVILILQSNGIILNARTVDIVLQFLNYSLLINIALMGFNLIPIPPLDGSHVLWHWFMKRRFHLHEIYFTVARFSYILLLGLMWTGALGVYFRLVLGPLFMIGKQLGALPLHFAR